MESITTEFIIAFICRNGIELSPTQTKLCLPVINRMYRKMTAGIKFPGIKVQDKMICDGHHRYLASLLANFPLDRLPGNTTSATSAVDWKSVIFEEDDWDTPAKIKILNEQDAKYNNLPIDKIVELLD